jgi:hypothetical protein
MVVISIFTVIKHPQDDILPKKSKDIPWWLKAFNWANWARKIFFKSKIN